MDVASAEVQPVPQAPKSDGVVTMEPEMPEAIAERCAMSLLSQWKKEGPKGKRKSG